MTSQANIFRAHILQTSITTLIHCKLMEKVEEVVSVLQVLQIGNRCESVNIKEEKEHIKTKLSAINAKVERRHMKKKSKNKREEDNHEDQEVHMSSMFSKGSNEEATSGCTSEGGRQKRKPHKIKPLLSVAHTVHRDGRGEVLDEQTGQEEMEGKLNRCIDSLTEKCAEARVAALKSLQQTFSSRVLQEFLIDRCLTISYSLERSLKKGNGEEQEAAAAVFTLLCVQLGSEGPAEECFKMLCPLLIAILTDSRGSVSARKRCATALGVCCYVSACEEDLVKSMARLESVFTPSYPNRDGMLPTSKPGSSDIYSAALQAWALLVTLCPASRLIELLDLHLPKLQACLESSDTYYRITVGETIALLVELRRDIDEDYKVEEGDILYQSLKSLATDSNKCRSKNDRRMQRCIFREVLHYIESEDFTEEEIHFSVERIYINTWTKRRIYKAFKEILGSGVTQHLQFNTILRDVFRLGDPLTMDEAAKENISCSEKHLLKSAAKTRTKQRNATRDKRAVFMEAETS